MLPVSVSAAPTKQEQQDKLNEVQNEIKNLDELKKEIQDYVKHRTAPYKYPRIVVFRDELPKTISGKIQRNKL